MSCAVSTARKQNMPPDRVHACSGSGSVSPCVSPHALLQSSHAGLAVSFAFPTSFGAVRIVVTPTTDETAPIWSFAFCLGLATLGRPAFELTLESCSCSFSPPCFPLCLCPCVGTLWRSVPSLRRYCTVSSPTALSSFHSPCHVPPPTPDQSPVAPRSSDPRSSQAAHCWDHYCPQRCSRTPPPPSATPRSYPQPSHWIHDTHQNALRLQGRDGRESSCPCRSSWSPARLEWSPAYGPSKRCPFSLSRSARSSSEVSCTLECCPPNCATLGALQLPVTSSCVRLASWISPLRPGAWLSCTPLPRPVSFSSPPPWLRTSLEPCFCWGGLHLYNLRHHLADRRVLPNRSFGLVHPCTIMTVS